MTTMNPKVDNYLIDGCGRCAYYQTQRCKVNNWPDELKELRRIVLDCGLIEKFKWSQPCYTVRDKNVLTLTAFRQYASLAFFKGALLKDKMNLLTAPGKSSQSSRQIRFTDVQDIKKMEAVLKAYINEAIEIEKAGVTVKFKKKPEPIPHELQQKFDEDPGLKKAFEALTPGRQRGYILHFAQPKQSKTRTSRIEKNSPKILRGEGINDHYRSMK